MSPTERDKLRAEAQELSRRIDARKAEQAAPPGRRKFFSWIELLYGLVVVVTLVGCFYYGLSGVATLAVIAAVFLAVVGVHLLVIRSRLKKLKATP
ncbi:MAG TPA: hypothetical protein VF110_09065 [Burkholderiales bacterium]